MALTPYPSLATLPEVLANGNRVPTVFGGASKAVVFLSGEGIIADGATDNSTRLQSILDLAQAGPLTIVHDLPGTVVADGLLVWSGTTIETLRGGIWKKKGYGGTVAGLGLPMFRNKHPLAGPATPTDQDIHFWGGFFDGNRRGFSSGGTTAYWAAKAPSYPGLGDTSWIALLANNQDQVIPVIGLYGVAGCSVRDAHFHDVPSYGVNCGNCADIFVENLSKSLNPGDTRAGDDLVQFEGYCSAWRIEGIRGEANDDLAALNANDGQDLYPAISPLTFPSYVASGPISNGVIRDLAFTGGTGTMLRMLAGNTSISEILLEHFRVESTSTSTQAIIYFDAFGVSGSPTYDDITIRDVRGAAGVNGLILFQNANATHRNIAIDGVSANGGGHAPIRMTAGTVSQLVLNNLASHGNPYLFEITGGSVADLHRGTYSAAGLTADIHDAGSRITTIRRS